MNREKTGRSRRSLTRNERELWVGFTRAIAPLRPVPAKPPEEVTEPAAVPDISPPAEPSKPREKPVPPLAGLDRRLRQRLARGRAGIDARIDLHGRTQSEAHGALLRFLQRAQAGGARIVLVITGKGSGASDFASARGVLKRQVPLWLALPEFRALVLGVEDAHVGHGGEGALYVRVRRGSVR